jgi:hypothetical protein
MNENVMSSGEFRCPEADTAQRVDLTGSGLSRRLRRLRAQSTV